MLCAGKSLYLYPLYGLGELPYGTVYPDALCRKVSVPVPAVRAGCELLYPIPCLCAGKSLYLYPLYGLVELLYYIP
jgi:RAB protein geranylgeranyltransferase component A